MSNYLENKLIDHLFRSVTFPVPTALYVGLFTATPSDTGGGTEVVGAGYARQNLAAGATNWSGTQGTSASPSTGTGGTTGNLVTITFPVATANWSGPMTAIGIFELLTGGNLLWWGPLSDPTKTVLNGDQFSFAANQLTVRIDD